MFFYRWPQTFDVHSILDEINKNNDWLANTSRQDTIPVQRETQTISLIQAATRPGLSINDTHEVKPSPLIMKYPRTLEAMMWFTRNYGGQMGRIAIVKLPPEKKVYPHIDAGAYYRARDRFHLVVQGSYIWHTHHGSALLKAGEMWWFDNQATHWVENVDTTDRITIIFDVEKPLWRDKVDLTNPIESPK